jgi:hypothetical protein
MAPGLPDWLGRIGTAASEKRSETIMKGWFSSMQMTLKDYKLLAFLLVVALLAVAYFDNQNASGMGVLTQARDDAGNRRKARAAAAAEQERVLTQAKNAASDRLVWLDNYQAAIKESKATGKPIFLEFRCGP